LREGKGREGTEVVFGNRRGEGKGCRSDVLCEAMRLADALFAD
jgi:hypothetical protein